MEKDKEKDTSIIQSVTQATTVSLAYPIERLVIELTVKFGQSNKIKRSITEKSTIEQNRTFDYRTVDDHTQSNIRLPNSSLFILRTFLSGHSPHSALRDLLIKRRIPNKVELD